MITELLLKVARTGHNLRDLSPEALARLLEEELRKMSVSQLRTEYLIVVASLVKRAVKLKVLILGPEWAAVTFMKRVIYVSS
jgi:3-methyladenine DNA glycosylase/8-oxoguanine DNA glycosylase